MTESADASHTSRQDEEFGQWIAAARGGDRGALQQIMQQIHGYLLLVANQELNPKLQGKVGPSDVVQETFVQLQKNLQQFQGSTEQELLAWARRILLNGIRDVQRRYGADMRDVAREQPLAGDSVLKVLQVDPAAEDAGPRTTAMERETQHALAVAIGRLPLEYREVLRLRTWEQRSFAEVGELMGRGADAARMLWNRAVRRLQQEMESSDERG